MRHLPLLLCLLLIRPLCALDMVDTDFAPVLRGVGSVSALAQRPSGGFVYTSVRADWVNGSTLSGTFLRFTEEGEWDESYQLVLDGTVTEIRVLDDGRILIAGSFTEIDGHETSRVARLLSDGSVDTGFSAESVDLGSVGPHPVITDLSVDEAGRIYVANSIDFFSPYGSAPTRLLYRLNADGDLDADFSPAFEWDASYSLPRAYTIRAVALTEDGKVLVGGDFLEINGVARPYLARLNADGTLDETYTPELDAAVHALLPVSGRGCYVGGVFTSVNGVERGGVARLLEDGELDDTFQSPFVSDITERTYVDLITMDGLGRLLLLGDLYLEYPGWGKDIVRIGTDGTVDETFTPWLSAVSSLLQLANGDVLVGTGGRSRSGENLIPALRQVDDETGGVSDFGPDIRGAAYPNYVSRWPDGRLLLGTSWLKDIDGTPVGGLTVLNPDGSIDGTFNGNLSRSISSALLLPDGRILAAGAFLSLAGEERKYVALLDEAGVPVEDFDLGAGPDASVSFARLMPDGKVLIAGNFSKIDGKSYNGLALLDLATWEHERGRGELWLDGLVDTTFKPNHAEWISVRDAAGQPDGKVVVVGRFSSIAGVAVKNIARLNPDGSLDTSFNASGQFDWAYPDIVKVDPDRGYIYLAGWSLSLEGETARRGVFRLLPDGTVDATFTCPDDISIVDNIELDPEGGLWVVGAFSAYTSDRKKIVHLLSDGSVDQAFDTGESANSYVEGLSLQAPASLYIIGLFTEVQGQPRSGLAKINLESPILPQVRFSPHIVTAQEGSSATFRLAETAPGESYAWYRGDERIDSAGTAELTLPGADILDAGEYSVRVTNTTGTMTASGVLNVEEYGLDEWLAACGLEGASGEEDSDRDGQSNAAEYLARTDPTRADSRMRLLAQRGEGGGLGLAWPSIRGREYTVETSVDLIDWDPWPGAAGLSGGRFDIPTAVDGPQRFWRVSVSKPEAR
ncbi:MAG: hypothetical protein Q7Q73_12255 [Verrucomicrobiota bacterium JB024]|nr:hypothetical protein [Verrucomicrobiota bacterium JB024]